MKGIQVRWQSTALHALFALEGLRGTDWVKHDELVETIKESAPCTGQAAVGSLNALANVGLAERMEHFKEGAIWRPTEAAWRAYELLVAK